MTMPSTVAPWIDLLAMLFVTTSAGVLLTALAAAWCKSAVWQRTLWQACLLGLFCLVAAELCGAAGWLGSVTTRLTERSSSFSLDAKNSNALTHGSSSGEPSIAESLGLYDFPPYELRSTRQGPKRVSDDFGTPDSPDDVDRHFAAGRFLGFPAGGTEASDYDPLIAADKDSSFLAYSSNDSVERRKRTDSVASGDRAQPAVLALWPAWLWAAGTCLLIARTLWIRLRLYAYVRRAAQEIPPLLFSEITSVAGQFAIRRVRAIQLPHLACPVAYGVWRSTIAAPPRFAEQFDVDQRRVILAHELAHLRDRDPAWHLTADVVAALVWWQPLVWWTRCRLRAASEAAADEASLTVAGGAEVLAGCLVEMGRRLVRGQQLGWLAFAEGGFRSGLGRRVTRLLRMERRVWRPAGRRSLAACLLVGPLVLSSGVCFCTAWARPQANLTEGDSPMTSLRQTWRQSLTALTVSAFLATGGHTLADDQVPGAADADEIVLSLLADDDRERDEDEYREEEEREEDEERERIERREAEEREFREHANRIEAEIHELLEAGDEEAAEESKAHLVELMQERRQRTAGQRRDRPDRERGDLEVAAEQLEREIRRHLEAGREDMAARLKEHLHELIQQADERDVHWEHAAREFEELARDLKREIARHLDEGRVQAAEEVEQHLREVIREHERHAAEFERHRRDAERSRHDEERAHLEERLRGLEHEIHESLEQGREDAAEELRHEAREISNALRQDREEFARRLDEDQRRSHERAAELERRVHHLREAAANLREAGYADRADGLIEEAERIAQGFRERPDGVARREPPRREPRTDPAVAELREEVHSLRRDIDRLHAMIREMAGRRDDDRDRDRPREADRERDRAQKGDRDRDREAEPR